MSKNKGECLQGFIEQQNQQYEVPAQQLNQTADVSATISSTSSLSSSSSSVSTTSRVPTPRARQQKSQVTQQQFVEEIDYNEIETEEVLKLTS